MTQEQKEAKQVVETMYSNLMDSLETTRIYSKGYGDIKFEINGRTTSINDVVDFSKLDIVSYIGYLFISKQNEQYFGNADHETVEMVFTEIYNKKVMNQLVKKYLR